MTSPHQLKPMAFPLLSHKPRSRSLIPATPQTQKLGLVDARKVKRVEQEAKVAVATQLANDLAAAEAHLNRTHIQNRTVIATAHMTRETAINLQGVIVEVSRISSETVRNLNNECLDRGDEDLKDAHRRDRAYQASLDEDQMSSELAAFGQQRTIRLKQSTLDADEETTQHLVRHVKKLNAQVLKSSRIVGGNDGDDDEWS